jgi:transposase
VGQYRLESTVITTRTLADLPCAGRLVTVHAHLRKFRCANGQCSQRVFSERFPQYVRPWARKTTRLADVIHALGVALGGRGAETLAPLLGVRVSDQTVLRLLMSWPDPVLAGGQVLGIDDFAFRRGRTYGTILVDGQQRHVLDLLPDRSQISCALWLKQYPQIQFISRDRGGDYAAAASLGAPQAEQIADRFHLLKNAGEVLERCLTRHHRSLRQAARALVPEDAVVRTTKRTPAEQQRQGERQAARQARYEHVQELHQQGLSSHQIAKQVGIARGTVLSYLRAVCFPETARRPRPRQIDPYLPYLQERWNAGEHNARTLWREVHEQGYPACDVQVRRIVSAWRAAPQVPGRLGIPVAAKAEVIYYSAARTRWLLLKPPADLSEREARFVALLTQLCPEIATAQLLLTGFHRLLSERCLERLDPWLEQCEQCRVSELVGFAQGLRRDYAAVQAALRYPYSQGVVEGHVNRLKLLKRQMYGRAGFALLRKRVLSQPALAP